MTTPILGGEFAGCPHCGAEVVMREVSVNQLIPNTLTRAVLLCDSEVCRETLTVARCPNPKCNGLVLGLFNKAEPDDDWAPKPWTMIHPTVSKIVTAHPSVPEQARADFREAQLVREFSPRAAAALFRRCLETVLKHQGYSEKNLYQTIGAAQKDLPETLRKTIDYVRGAGNIGVHNFETLHSGELLTTTYEEVEWCQTILEGLFYHYYEGPYRDKKRLEEAASKNAALEAKLKTHKLGSGLQTD